MGIFQPRPFYKPFEYGDITNPLIDAMWASHWTVNEFNFTKDIQDFNTNLTEKERQVVKRALLMISQVEVSVKSYWSNVGKLIPKPEISEMGSVFGGVEVIHSRAYSEILTKLGLNDEFSTLLDTEIVKNRVKYLTKYNEKNYEDDRKNIYYSLALFSLFTENVSLFSQFYTILGFNRYYNVLKDTANVVQYTSKEENLHAAGGIAILNKIREEYPDVVDYTMELKIYEEAREAYDAELRLIEWILDGYENEFLSYDILKTYLGIRMNDSLEKIGFEKMFDVDEDLAEKTLWMEEEIYVPALTDFFHKKPIDYQKAMKSFDAGELF